MNSSNCRNWKLKLAGITQNGLKSLHCGPSIKIADRSGFAKKKDSNNNID